MNSKSHKEKHNQPNKQQHSINQPLISPSRSNLSDSDPENNQIDVVRLVNKQQQSRVTKINLNFYQSGKKEEPKPTRLTDYHIKNRYQQQEQQFDDNYSTKKKVEKEQQRESRLTQHQSFISSYQSNHIIGIIIFLLFVVFVSVQMIVTSFIVTKKQRAHSFHKQEAILIILSSQLVYYFLLRYSNTKSKKKFFKQNSVLRSFQKVLSKTTYCKDFNDQRNVLIKYIFQKPYLVLIIVAISVMISQIIYCWVASESIFLFHSQPNEYMIPTIYWSNFVLPILITNFYMNRPTDQNSLKLKIFPFILLGFMFESIIQSILFFFLMVFKIMHAYLQSKQGFQIFHVDHLIKAILLGLSLFFTIVKIKVTTSNSFFSFQILIIIAKFLADVAIVVASILITRVLGMVFLKEQLYKYFYTETHIHLALILTTILMYSTYLNFYDDSFDQVMIYSFLGIIFLLIIAAIIYMQGKQKDQVKINIENN